MLNGRRKIALITGTSSGIGAVFADRLASQGYDLIVVARRRDRLEKQAEMLRSQYQIGVDILVADISKSDELVLVVEKIANEGDLNILVNNAGVGTIEPFTEMTLASIQNMININVLALTSLTHAALPGMLSRGAGIIINVASGLAFARMPNASVYAATKAFVSQFTQVLHQEVGDKGIQLQALIPGLVRTEFGSDGTDSTFYDQFPPELVMSPEALVDSSFAGLELGELVCIPALPDYELWLDTDAAIQHIGNGVSSDTPAERYTSIMRR